jgi:hypothetical protein
LKRGKEERQWDVPLTVYKANGPKRKIVQISRIPKLSRAIEEEKKRCDG